MLVDDKKLNIVNHLGSLNHRDPKAAFNDAIANGILSEDQSKGNFAGNYMYMHSEGKRDFFKHIDTRNYISSNNTFLGKILGSVL